MSEVPTEFNQPCEEELVERYRSGDESVLLDITAAYGAAVIRFLTRRFPKLRGYIEDVFSSMLEPLWRARELYEPSKLKFTSWLYLFARRQAIDISRRSWFKARQLECELDPTWISQSSDESDEEDRCIQHSSKVTGLEDHSASIESVTVDDVCIQPCAKGRLLTDLERILATFNDIDKSILLTWAITGGKGEWTVELAKELNLAPGTIRTRKLRLRQRLKALLEELGHECPKPTKDIDKRGCNDRS